MAGFFSSLKGLFGGDKPVTRKESPEDIYRSLRKQALTLDPTKIGFVSSASNRIWGVLMETGYPDAIATLVMIADGTVSLYFSTGGGIIGVGQHDGPRKACESFLEFAPQFINQLQPTNEFPFPAVGNTRFYFLTCDGIFTVETLEDDLGNNRVPLSPLFHKAQEVITQARLVDEQMRGNQGSPANNAEAAAMQLIRAAATGDCTEVQKLLRQGIDVNGADKTGLTPAMAAAYEGKEDALQLILDSKYAVDTKDASGYTALMFACNAGYSGCAKQLIDNGSSVNVQANDGSTPIMFAAQHGHNEVIRILLAHGADPHIKSVHGLSAVGFAKQNNFVETESLLLG